MQELITSKKSLSSLSGGGIKVKMPGTTSTASTSINSVLPLEYQLAFNRGEIPGTTYKDIVDQAIKTVSPNTSLYNSLLKEQSQAIAAADKEGKTLRKLQAQAKAASTIGNTTQDAIDLYNFWVSEYYNYANTDPEYATQALINAGNARTTAETRNSAEAKAAESAMNKSIKDNGVDYDATYSIDGKDIVNVTININCVKSQWILNMADLHQLKFNAAGFILDIKKLIEKGL